MTKKAFFICPVRGADQTETQKIIDEYEAKGWKIHFPPRDTNQNDKTGYRICNDNLNAIINSDVVFIYWDGKSQGGLFDAGMAFALGKPIKIISVPEILYSKSFQDMFTEWEKLNNFDSARYNSSGELWSDIYYD